MRESFGARRGARCPEPLLLSFVWGHFWSSLDHITPYSKGGSSKDPANIQILCRRYNLAKHDKIG